jgi:hypothetical protein
MLQIQEGLVFFPGKPAGISMDFSHEKGIYMGIYHDNFR